MILGFEFKEFFIAISTPPPFLLNFLGLLGSIGWEEEEQSNRKVLYICSGRISLFVIVDLSQVSFKMTTSGDVLKM